MIHLRKYRFTFFLMSLSTIVAVAAPLFLITSCQSLQNTPREQKERENLRAMTRTSVLPADEVVARIENGFPRTTVGSLAKVVRARIRLKSNDYAGAASLLDSDGFATYVTIPDHVLWMRGNALEQAGRRVEARAAYEKLARDYPNSLRADGALIRVAQMLMQDGQAAAVPTMLKPLIDKDNASALLITAKAYDQAGDVSRAQANYRRVYFFAPASAEASEASTMIPSMRSTGVPPATAEEALARAEKLFSAKRYAEAYDAYTSLFLGSPASATSELASRRVIAAANARKFAEATTALSGSPATTGEARAEAIYNVVLAYARGKQWAQARTAAEDLRRQFPSSLWTMRAFVQSGQRAEEAKNDADASYFYRAAVNFFPGNPEVTPAHFYIAWVAHEGKNFNESSRLLTEHVAVYAGNNTDFRGKSAYWAARDSERAGKVAEARAIYQGLLDRYDANWYGYLSKQRLADLDRAGAAKRDFPADSQIGRAVASLKTVTVAEETAGAAEGERIAKADHLSIAGLDDWAFEELARASATALNSPRVNLAIAKIYRSRNDNVQAFNALRRSYPDYSQMKVEEMRPDEWDVFYPLGYWDIIKQEARARGLDPYQVAGLIRQESVFNPRAVSSARAYGLMQLIMPTAVTTSRRVGTDRAISMEALFEPRLNIQLGTAYFKEQLEKYGRIEYVAVAYNAGPGRVVQWRASLPLQIDEFQEAVPFRETKLYIQGVVRNWLQYQRLYDENGNFRPEVGARAVYPTPTSSPSPAEHIKIRRAIGDEEE